MNRFMRILVVDDSIVVRMVLNQLLTVEVQADVFMAHDGNDALVKAKSILPDLVILDVEMPQMGGLQALRELRQYDPHLRIIMFSAFTDQDTEATVEALSLGASDFIPKHDHFLKGEIPISFLKKVLIPKVRTLLGAVQQAKTGNLKILSPSDSISFSRINNYKFGSNLAVVVIAVSTGGPNALEKLLPMLPSTFRVPILVVQHIPAEFSPLLVKRLSEKCALKVVEAESGMPVKAGTIYFAPGGKHMEIMMQDSISIISLNTGPLVNSCRPAADYLFKSAATTLGSGVLGAILTGMGQDGLEGAKAIKSRNGYLIAQDEKTSVVWGMPGSAVKAGLADEILSIDQIGPRLCELIT